MNRAAVINVVGLTGSLLGEHTPRMKALADKGGKATIRPAFPAVTCTAQANYVTGRLPTEHGIVGNGWYNRDLAEVQFWKQPDQLVQAPKIWEELKGIDPGFTCAKLFWWYNMYGSVDYSITPRPMYPADGRKIFDIYSSPSSIRSDIQHDLGRFPFATFWGPAAGSASSAGASDAVSRWIAESAKWIEERYQPTLNLIYLPHLDYNLQRLGPAHPAVTEDLQQVDRVVGDLIDYFRDRSITVFLLSEYGITPVETPIHLNRRFREQGWLTVKEELGLELLDAGASRAFAVADHQVAHIYLNDPELAPAVRELVGQEPGVERVIEGDERKQWGVDHPRAGQMIALAHPNAWFTYYYWLDDARAPDFARCVDIHRKPGYDPIELFVDPKLKWPKGRIAWRLLQKKLGFRMLMDVIPLDATLAKGSHGHPAPGEAHEPILITDQASLTPSARVESTEVYQILKQAIIG